MSQPILHGPETIGSCSREPFVPILFEDNHLLVVVKPAGLLSQADHTGDDDLLTLCKRYLVERYGKPGRAFLGLVHRLDRPVGGVMVLAKTSKSASRLSEQIRNRTFRKEYLAVCHGETAPNGWLTHHLSKEGDRNRVRVTDQREENSQRAELSFVRTAFDSRRVLSLLRVNLITGRPHQVRAQFAAEGHPLAGDQKYGGATEGSGIALTTPALYASVLEFQHPVTADRHRFIAPAPQGTPWQVFSSALSSLR